MSFRLVPRAVHAVAAVAVSVVLLAVSVVLLSTAAFAQSPAPSAPAATSPAAIPPVAIPPAATPPVATSPAPETSQAAPAQPGDTFGEDATLTARPIIYVKGSGTWDKAFDTVTGSFKKIKAYLDKEGLKPAGLPMTIFTATDDTGFEFEAAVPIADTPKNPPHGDLLLGQSPQGQALKFVHHGSYDDLDNTYEAITNYLDDKRLEAKDMFIEEYVTDPVTADVNKLVVNVYVLIKPSQTPPG
jgi:effector-binding domain-containing protein